MIRVPQPASIMRVGRRRTVVQLTSAYVYTKDAACPAFWRAIIAGVVVPPAHVVGCRALSSAEDEVHDEALLDVPSRPIPIMLLLYAELCQTGCVAWVHASVWIQAMTTLCSRARAAEFGSDCELACCLRQLTGPHLLPAT